ncbi:MAG: RDD family protein [Firmicutes bacterium]|nr:RDD family protein [Bacillota bacterium]
MFCSKCGTPNPDNSKFCQGCGNGLAVDQPAAQPPAPPPSPPPAAPPPPTAAPASWQASAAPGPAGWTCPNCRSQVGADKAFCTYCGTPMSGPAQQWPMAPPVPPAASWGPQMGAQLVGAGVGIRGVATIIDGILFMILGFIMALMFGTTSSTGFELSGAPAFLLMIIGLLYFVLLEGTIGATLGKLLLGLRVVKTDGRKCDIVGSLIRNLLRIVDALPFLYIVGMITIWVTKRKQRVGDLAAGTLVVKKNAVRA